MGENSGIWDAHEAHKKEHRHLGYLRGWWERSHASGSPVGSWEGTQLSSNSVGLEGGNPGGERELTYLECPWNWWEGTQTPRIPIRLVGGAQAFGPSTPHPPHLDPNKCISASHYQALKRPIRAIHAQVSDAPQPWRGSLWGGGRGQRWVGHGHPMVSPLVWEGSGEVGLGAWTPGFSERRTLE